MSKFFEIRTLRADEIECRVKSITPRGAILLLYKDARCDQRILDETFGPMNWQRRHLRDNANCIISIWDEAKKQWIEKEDTGTESNTEKEKGLASDSFKRAAFCWGIGRELYTAPSIFISSEDMSVIQKGSGYTTYDRFSVYSIEYNSSREIDQLAIMNENNGRIVFEYSNKSNLSHDKRNELRKEVLDRANKDHVTIKDVINKLKDMFKFNMRYLSDAEADKIINFLKGEKPKLEVI